MNVPEGWKLVPIEPTLEMVNAGANADPERESVWAAYLAAAPAVVQAEPSEWQPIATAPEDGRFLAYHPEFANNFWITSNSSLEGFTHWMPLPAAPKVSP